MIIVKSNDLYLHVYSHYIDVTPVSFTGSKYKEMDEWCVDVFKHTTRIAYNKFLFNHENELNWFLLKWSE